MKVNFARQVLAIGLSALVLAVALAQKSQTVLYRVKLTQPISTKANQKGDKILAQVISPEDHRGDILEGTIRECKSSGTFKKKSVLNFTFSSLYTKGSAIPVHANVQKFFNSKGQANVDEEGRIIEKKSEVKKGAVRGALGAGAGAVAAGARGVGAGLTGLLFMRFGVKAPNITFDAGSTFDVGVTQQGPAR